MKNYTERNMIVGERLTDIIDGILFKHKDDIDEVYKREVRDKKGQFAGIGPDHIIWHGNKKTFCIEAKNWPSNFSLDEWNFEEKILSRFLVFEEKMKVKPEDYTRIVVLAGIKDTAILRELLFDGIIHGIFIVAIEEDEDFDEKSIEYIEEKLLRIFNGSAWNIYKQEEVKHCVINTMA